MALASVPSHDVLKNDHCGSIVVLMWVQTPLEVEEHVAAHVEGQVAAQVQEHLDARMDEHLSQQPADESEGPTGRRSRNPFRR